MGYADTDAARGADNALQEQPPLMALASRIINAVETFHARHQDVVQAGHRTADRFGGEAGPEKEPGGPATTRGQTTMGFGGYLGEIEAVVQRVEAMLDDAGRQSERMINRLTRLG